MPGLPIMYHEIKIIVIDIETIGRSRTGVVSEYTDYSYGYYGGRHRVFNLHGKNLFFRLPESFITYSFLVEAVLLL